MAKGDFHERGRKIKEFGLPSYKGVFIYVQKYENASEQMQNYFNKM